MSNLDQLKSDMTSFLAEWGSTFKVFRESVIYNDENKAVKTVSENGEITADNQPKYGRTFRDERGDVIEATSWMETTFDADVSVNDIIKTAAGVEVGRVVHVMSYPDHRVVLIKES